LLRIDDLTIRAAVDSGRELLPFVGGIRASKLAAAQSKVFRGLKRTLSESLWILDMVLFFS
jgi:hypothetical protein